MATKSKKDARQSWDLSVVHEILFKYFRDGIPVKQLKEEYGFSDGAFYNWKNGKQGKIVKDQIRNEKEIAEAKSFEESNVTELVPTKPQDISFISEENDLLRKKNKDLEEKIGDQDVIIASLEDERDALLSENTELKDIVVEQLLEERRNN